MNTHFCYFKLILTGCYFILLSGFFVFQLSAQTTLWVSNTSDSGPGSLRQAILDANVIPGSDNIHFNIPGGGVHTIQPLSALPSITDPLVIDGYTQPGASPNTNATSSGLGLNTVLMIEIDGSLSGGNINGLVITADHTTIRGIVINGYENSTNFFHLIYLDQVSHCKIQGNLIGTLPSGLSTRGHIMIGIGINQGSDNQIGGMHADERNLISPENRTGISIRSDNCIIQGNLV